MESNKNLVYKIVFSFFLIFHFPPSGEDTLYKAIPYFALCLLLFIDFGSYLFHFYKNLNNKTSTK